MSIDEVFETIKSNMYLGIVGVIILAVLIGVGYFLIYKKLLRGRKKMTAKQLIMIGLIAGYLIMVMGLTFLNRPSGMFHSFNFSILSSYKEAWNNFDVRTWQSLIFNIIMFVPLGILLPIVHKRFQNITFTLAAGLMLTLLIELLQFVTASGVFDLADIFNNLMGTLVGYSIVMTTINLKKRRYRVVLKYFSPFFIVLVMFVGIFAYYNLKEFGNLSQNYSNKLNMKNTTITTNLNFDSEENIVPIYKAPSLSKDAAKEFVVDFYENINIDTSNIEIIDYHEVAVYWVRGGKDGESYNIWLNNLDGSFEYTDFSFFDDDVDQISAPKEVVLEKLEDFNITMLAETEITSDEEGVYNFTANKNIDGNTLINGVLTCSYYNDDTIKNINNNMVVYEKVKDISVISEKSAYEKITEGKFKYLTYDKINTIEINDVSLDYRLDSKGYYQPVYIFNSLINDTPHSIIIPALS